MTQKIEFICLVNLRHHDVGILRCATLGKGTKNDPVDYIAYLKFFVIIGVLQYLVRHM
jgi:hypothetical protein